MRKKFFKFNFFLLCACFTLSNAHAMTEDDMDIERTTPKRPRSESQGKEQPVSKRLKTEPHPAETPTNGELYSYPDFKRHATNLLGDIFSFLPENERWKLRLVNRGWKAIVNASITDLDLSPIYRVPSELRSQLMNSQGFMYS